MNNYKQYPSLYDGLFLVSPSGEIFRRRGDVYKSAKPSITTAGYFSVSATINGKQKRFLVHRLIAMAYIPNPEQKPYVNHIDGNKKNNHIGNLEWCTSQENSRHAKKIGLINADTYLRASLKRLETYSKVTNIVFQVTRKVKDDIVKCAADKGFDSYGAYIRKLIADDSGLDL